MAKDQVTEILEKTEGKRAKTKKLDEIPEDTKSVKLPSKMTKSLAEKFPKAKLAEVKVHSGKAATEACKTLGVRAFTHGSDIYVANSGGARDEKLLAHELSHVMQQGAGRIPPAKKGKVLTTK